MVGVDGEDDSATSMGVEGGAVGRVGCCGRVGCGCDSLGSGVGGGVRPRFRLDGERGVRVWEGVGGIKSVVVGGVAVDVSVI